MLFKIELMEAVHAQTLKIIFITLMNFNVILAQVIVNSAFYRIMMQYV